MHDDHFPAAEKILTDIENIFKRDKDLKDFEILPVTVGENKSPVLHAEHTLGLEKWCVRHLYLHVYHKLMNLKQQQRLRREDPDVVSRLLLGGVLLNPDCTSLWNIRREFVVMGRFDPFSELHVNAVTLSRRPKTSEAFVYRRWILSRLTGKSSLLDSATSSYLLEQELRISLMTADRYPNNYYAWNHRMWVMSNLPQAHDVFIDEWLLSEDWVSRHVSEHSGLQYRQYLLKQAFQHLGHTDLCSKFYQTLSEFFQPLTKKGPNGLVFKDSRLSNQLYATLLNILESKVHCSPCPIDCQQNLFVLDTGLLAYELLLVSELIRLYPGHEALWCHRRFVLFSFYSLVKKIYKSGTEGPDITDGIPLPKAQKLSVFETDVESGFLWNVVLWHDDALYKECSSRTPEECYQSKLAHRHQKWLKEVLFCTNSQSSCATSSTSYS